MMSISTMAVICNTIKKVWYVSATASLVMSIAKQGKNAYITYKNNRNNKEEAQ